MTSNSYDIVIVGAGPAGTSCALALKNSGLKVLLVDKSAFPRHKTCGDAIPGPTLKYLKEIDPEIVNRFETYPLKHFIKSSAVFSAKGTEFVKYWKLKAYNSSREAFDNFLMEEVKNHSDIEVRENFSIQQIKKKENGFTITDKENDNIETQFLIGCDGANSVVRRSLFPENQHEDGVALACYYEGIEMHENRNEFFFLDNFPGYFWIFPVENKLFNVGIGLIENQDHKASSLKKAFDEAISSPLIKKRFQNAKAISKLLGHKLPFGGIPINRVQDRCLLAGDAGHLVDSSQGHGIDKAVFSGIQAAKQAIDSFERHQFDSTFMESYNLAIEQGVGKELKRNYRIMRLFTRNPFLLNFVFGIQKLRLKFTSQN